MTNHPNRRKPRASVGSVSSGPLRDEDLISAFSWELAHIGGKTKYRKLLRKCNAWREVDDSAESGECLVSDLMDALNEYAPTYCCFGSHEGDGADFGFWPIMESIDELPRVEGSDEARKLGEDCAYVNDHGNVTVYSRSGRVLIELV